MKTTRRFDRRRFLAALAVTIPGIAFGCTAGRNDTLTDDPWRPSEGGSPPPRPSLGDSGATDPGLDGANDWEKRVAQLEAQGPIYTADAPGPWAAKVASHVPQIIIDGANVTIKVAHPMHPVDDAGPEHYITTIYARDQTNKIVWLKEFKVADAAASTTFPLPSGTDTVVAYAHCNIHGLWSSRHIPAGTGGATATRNEAWETDVAALEAGGLYSATSEGPWIGKAAKHVPTVEAGRGSVLLTVSHEMRPGIPLDAGADGAADAGGDAGDGGDGGAKEAGEAGVVEHYIGRLYIRNQDGLVVGYKKLAATDPLPIALFSLPLGTTKVTAFAWCNIHGVWKSETLDVLS